MKEKIQKIFINIRENFSAFITCILFVALLFGLSVLSMINPIRAFSENENRYLAQKPEFSVDTLFDGTYTKEYEEFITDQFVFRDRWIGLKTNVERSIGKQDINGVYFGKDGYLIEKHSNADIDSKEEVRNKERLIEFTKKYGELLGEDHVKVMLVPTASEILDQKLPPFAMGYDQNQFISDVKQELDKEGKYFIDIRDMLKDHKEEYIYYKTDHHWTSQGAFYAYNAWANEMGFTPFLEADFNKNKVTDEFYGTIYSKVNVNVSPDDIYLYEQKKGVTYNLEYNMGEKETDTLYDMDKLKEKDKYSVFMGGNNAVVKVKTNVNNGRKLLVIKDSFAHSFVPFAVNHFEQTDMLDFRYFKMGISQYIDENDITDILVLYNTINFVKDKNTSVFTK